MALTNFRETVGYYEVEYERVPSIRREGRHVWVYRAMLDQAPIQLPGQMCGNAETLSGARNAVRERIPDRPWHLKYAGIKET